MAADDQLGQFNWQMNQLDGIQNPTQKLNILKEAMKIVEGIKDANQQLVPLKRMKTNFDLLLPQLRGNDSVLGKNLNDVITQRLDELQKSNGSSAVKSSLPIDFSIYDESLHYLLYITDDPTEEHKLKLELKNTSNAAINFTTLKGMEADPWHFELRFRKGTLSDKTRSILLGKDPQIKSLLSPDDQKVWDMLLDENASGTKAHVSLYFRGKGLAALNPGSSMILPLQHISADAGSGARGTHVEFFPRQITFNDANKTPVTGYREQHLFITNHSGQKQIPLHVGFVGSNKILNDGAAHPELKLRLRIQNVAKPGQKHFETTRITLKSNSAEPDKASTFILSFDIGTKEQKPWGLFTDTESNALTCPAKAMVTSQMFTLEGISENDLNQKPLPDTIRKKFKDNSINLSSTATLVVSQVGKEWTIRDTPLTYIISSENQALNVYSRQLVDLGKLTPSSVGESRQFTLRPGKNLELRPDDYVEIELSGLQSSLQSGLARMFVNYNNIPGYWDGHFVLMVEKTPLLFSDTNNVGIGTSVPQAKLNIINSEQDASGNTLVLGKTDKSNLRLGYHADYSWIQSHGGKPLAINQISNNVGIGTKSPSAKLEVAANLIAAKDSDVLVGLKVTPTFDDKDKKDVKHYGLLVTDGNVGIGTTSPSAKLDVALKSDDANTNPLSIGKGTTSYLVMLNNGNVGIGTTSPSAKLEVAAKLTAAQNSDVLVGLKVAPTFDDKDKKDVKHYGLLVTDGNVGIGTTSPMQKLLVQGNSGSSVDKDPDNQMQYAGQLAIKGFRPQLDFINTNEINHNDWAIQVAENRMHFIRQPWNYTGLVLDGNDNVGIGTALPGAKLEVIGDVKISGSLKPNYDSGWVKDDNKTQHQKLFPHGFKAIPSLLTIQFSPDKVNVYPLTWPWNGSEPGRSDQSGNPLSIVMNTENVILNISHGDALHRYWDATKPSDMTTWTEGYWRVMAWK